MNRARKQLFSPARTQPGAYSVGRPAGTRWGPVQFDAKRGVKASQLPSQRPTKAQITQTAREGVRRWQEGDQKGALGLLGSIIAFITPQFIKDIFNEDSPEQQSDQTNRPLSSKVRDMKLKPRGDLRTLLQSLGKAHGELGHKFLVDSDPAERAKDARGTNPGQNMGSGSNPVVTTGGAAAKYDTEDKARDAIIARAQAALQPPKGAVPTSPKPKPEEPKPQSKEVRPNKPVNKPKPAPGTGTVYVNPGRRRQFSEDQAMNKPNTQKLAQGSKQRIDQACRISLYRQITGAEIPDAWKQALVGQLKTVQFSHDGNEQPCIKLSDLAAFAMRAATLPPQPQKPASRPVQFSAEKEAEYGEYLHKKYPDLFEPEKKKLTQFDDGDSKRLDKLIAKRKAIGLTHSEETELERLWHLLNDDKQEQEHAGPGIMASRADKDHQYSTMRDSKPVKS